MTHIPVSALEVSFFLNKYVWNEQTSQKKKIIRVGLSGNKLSGIKLNKYVWNKQTSQKKIIIIIRVGLSGNKLAGIKLILDRVLLKVFFCLPIEGNQSQNVFKICECKTFQAKFRTKSNVIPFDFY